MLNSAVLDVAIGLVFCFSSVALVASTLYESIASIFKLRASSLLQGIKALLNDKSFNGLAKEIYNHALVNPRSAGTIAGGEVPAIKPSYIAPEDFASALIETIQKGQDASTGLEASIAKIPNEQIKQLLQGMFERADGKVEKVRAELAEWFDSSMDRVSGAYKRQAQLCTFVIGLVLAILFNIDTFRLFRALWNHPVLMAQISIPNAPNAADALTALRSLPVGWPVQPESPDSYILAGFGWLTTASSVLFGAPFWFDLLQQLVNLRGAGGKPQR